MEEYLWLSIILLMISAGAVFTLVFIVFRNEKRNMDAFFKAQIEKRNGTHKKILPFGFHFDHRGLPVTVYVLQGKYHLSADLMLTEDRELLLIKKYSFIPDWLYCSPRHKRILLNTLFDQHYIVQGKDEILAQQVLSNEIQDSLMNKGNVTRIAINKKKYQASFMTLKRDNNKIDRSIDNCLEVIDKIFDSSLAHRVQKD